ncbi:unnamed protein product [Rotaria sordida]|uniref:DNA polymerase epsilon catalytic subunit n=1 Tax=Rotaria sordida TaxID=392033 RepID=A0A813SR51_9BILA|nr:unnamed protein product [Rotaria sordida]
MQFHRLFPTVRTAAPYLVPIKNDIWCVLPAAFPENYELIIRDPSRPKFIISYPCSLLNLIIKDHYTNDQYHELVDKGKQIYEICLENSIFF